MNEPTHNIGDRVERLYNTVEDMINFYAPEDPAVIAAVKNYANAYARFELARVEAELFRGSNFSAARAVAAQASVLDALA